MRFVGSIETILKSGLCLHAGNEVSFNNMILCFNISLLGLLRGLGCFYFDRPFLIYLISC